MTLKIAERVRAEMAIIDIPMTRAEARFVAEALAGGKDHNAVVMMVAHRIMQMLNERKDTRRNGE